MFLTQQYQKLIGLLTVSLLLLIGCAGDSGNQTASNSSSSDSNTMNSKKATDPNVIICETADPDKLNPITYQSAGSGYIQAKMMYPLVNIDFATLELVPVIAKSRGKIEERPDGGLLITYEIREEAKWDDGTPITAKDVAFTYKLYLAPSSAVDNARLRPYYEFIEDVKFYDDNPRKFTVVCKEKYIRAESSSGTIAPLPRSVYDPEGLLEKFTIKQLSQNPESAANDPDLKKFGKQLSDEKFSREKGYIAGAGPYEFDYWETKKRIVLKRKKDWWGNALKGTNTFFDVNAPQITYEIVQDPSTRIVALKSEKIDVMRTIPPKDFIDLEDSDKFKQNFKKYTPPFLSYTYLGLNSKNSKLKDKKVRQALGHILDVQTIIETVQYGLGEQITSGIHPTNPAYNKSIKPFEYSIEKGKKMLEEAGWKDSNGDGLLDKNIAGENVKFEFDFIYNSTNKQREATGLIFQESARQAGIKINVIPQEWSVYLENLKNHNFDIYYGAWVSTPLPYEPKQIWHTDSQRGGSNYVGFGNAKTDQMIETIRETINDAERLPIVKELQAIQHDEACYLFMFSPKERIAIHKRFTSAKAYTMRPGYWAPSLALSK